MVGDGRRLATDDVVMNARASQEMTAAGGTRVLAGAAASPTGMSVALTAYPSAKCKKGLGDRRMTAVDHHILIRHG
jgi:hypothetical protein